MVKDKDLLEEKEEKEKDDGTIRWLPSSITQRTREHMVITSSSVYNVKMKGWGIEIDVSELGLVPAVVWEAKAGFKSLKHGFSNTSKGKEKGKKKVTRRLGI